MANTQTRHEESGAKSNHSVQPRIEDANSYCAEMLSEMESEFNDVGNSILSKMNEMGKRMDDLESSISDLMNQAGLESDTNNQGPLTPNGSPSKDSKDQNSAVL